MLLFEHYYLFLTSSVFSSWKHYSLTLAYTAFLILRNTALHHTGRLEKSMQAQAGNTHCIALPGGMALEMINKASGALMWVLS